MPGTPRLSRSLASGLLILLALAACTDREPPTAPAIPDATSAAMQGGVPAPIFFFALANGSLTLTWYWSDDQPWDLVSFDLEVAGKKVEGDWSVRPYSLGGSGLGEIYAFTWHGEDFTSVPQACVSVMAKNASGAKQRTTTFHAKNCQPVAKPPTAMAGLRAETITAAADFACGLSVAGDAYCWGRNDYGQLGDGTTNSRANFWPVAGGHTFTQISAFGWYPAFDDYRGHVCALTSSGAAYCWGYNGSGQLGDGTSVDRHVPTPVASGLQFGQIDLGIGYSCALTAAGAAYCWGYNGFGQLGEGTTSDRWTPQPVSGGLTFAQISAGGQTVLGTDAHTCGVTSAGAAYCWGSNKSGQIGNGQSSLGPAYFATPSAVAGGLTFHEVSAGGAHSCGVTTSGLAYCWGNGMGGQVGAGSYAAPYLTPAGVAGGHTFARISAGAGHSCGVTTTGGAYCWGYNNEGQLGSGSGYQSAVPSAVTGGLSFRRVSAGRSLTCGVDAAGGGYCWGGTQWSMFYHVGAPLRKLAHPLAAELGAGGQHACAMTPGGDAYCWGFNVQGQLGIGTTSDEATGVIVGGAYRFARMAPGRDFTCGLTDTGSAYCWGSNFYGQLGDGTKTSSSTPGPVAGGPAFAKIAAGDEHACGLTASGAAWCWGQNSSGQLGDGTTTERLVPTPVSGGYTFTELVAGDSHTCALTSAGAAWCWGNDGVIPHVNPLPVDGGLTFTKLAAGDRFTCGLSGGAAYCWGANPDGQLGDGTTFNHPFPEPVSGAFAFTALGAGDSHVCGVTATGAAYCWGWNYLGQLGDGTTSMRTTPVPVQGGFVFEKITAGNDFSCAADLMGISYCWGANDKGQLGDGTKTARMTPTRVVVWPTFR